MPRALNPLVALALWTVVAVSGCEALVETDDQALDPITSTPTEEVGGASETEASSPAIFFPDGTAAQNEPYFLEILMNAGAGSRLVPGDEMRQAVVDAGFESTAIEVTPDSSLIALPADSITLAIAVGEDCLVGQWGKDWVVSQVTPKLGTGLCLVGETDSLD